MKLHSRSHCKGEASYHIVFCPKYRHSIFEYEPLKKYCIYLLKKQAKKYGLDIRALEIMDDHVHLFTAILNTHSISQVVQLFKGYSARMMFKAFPWLKQYEKNEPRFWGGHFWSRGYFYRSVGSTTDKAVEFYIEISQKKHMKEKYYQRGDERHSVSNEDPYITYLQGGIKFNNIKESQITLDSYAG